MRKISLIYLLGLLLAACGAGQPQLELEADRLALGDVVNGEIVDRDVTVYNRGAAALNVEAISTSCGCTSATLEPMTIPPGGSAVLHIEFDSGAHGPELTGTLIRQVFIASNDPQRPEVILEIEAEILPPVLP